MARYIAKNPVAAGVASRLEVEIDYATEGAPVVNIDSFGTAKIPDENALVNECFDLRPAAIIDTLNFSPTCPRPPTTPFRLKTAVCVEKMTA